MIINCGRCKALYDVSGQPAGGCVTCACGDVLIIPDLKDMEGTTVIHNYVRRLAEEEDLRLDLKTGDSCWEFQRGSARIEITYDEAEETITVESVIMPLPLKASYLQPLFQRVLELNHCSTGEARFAICEGNIVVTFTRDILGLDYTEFHSAVASVSRTADDYDDELILDFGVATSDSDNEETEEIDLSQF